MKTKMHILKQKIPVQTSTEYDGSEKTQDETEENMSEESIEDNTVEE